MKPIKILQKLNESEEHLAPFSLAEDLYKYTTSISMTEDELFDKVIAKHPETANYDYNQMRHFIIRTMMNDIENNPKIINNQLENDVNNYYDDSSEINDIWEMYLKLKEFYTDEGIDFNIKYFEEDPFAPTAEDWDDINHWYNDDPREEWEKKSKLENNYRYISTHGVGPGTLPKDVQLIKSEDVGSGRVALYLSRPLSDEELKKYDIRPEYIQESVPAEHEPFINQHKCPYCTGPMSDEEYRVFGMCRDCYDNGVE